MTSSLVGSEMCIRDSSMRPRCRNAAPCKRSGAHSVGIAPLPLAAGQQRWHGPLLASGHFILQVPLLLQRLLIVA
eukprot:5313319-Prorocentrum_lima.AAC.1